MLAEKTEWKWFVRKNG